MANFLQFFVFHGLFILSFMKTVTLSLWLKLIFRSPQKILKIINLNRFAEIYIINLLKLQKCDLIIRNNWKLRYEPLSSPNRVKFVPSYVQSNKTTTKINQIFSRICRQVFQVFSDHFFNFLVLKPLQQTLHNAR